AQDRGRGRRGRSWCSPPGHGLYLSVLVPRPEPAAWLPLVAGLAAAEAVETAAGRAGADPPLVRLKWPNDLYCRGRKIGGILCEAADRDLWVVGIGINCTTPEAIFPPEVRGRAASIASATGRAVPPGRLFRPLSRALGAWLHRLDREGPGTARAEIRRRDALAGRAVEAADWGAPDRSADRSAPLRGRAAGIDETGALVLVTGSGDRIHLVSGTLHPLEPLP
ncbi:biotin--[acetyl-CoA-carboxylase] ligase, partial [Dissulfurirhabdus thermomarina]